ncbi:MAG: hypothetical protein MRY21_06305 [Simkaniaceae bacterium]|nr:hypothetical protein [Simkaniaceae bacterium]
MTSTSPLSDFTSIRELNLPVGEYLITGSGALGVRGLRPIGDIDILVTQELWDHLAKTYPIFDKNSVRFISLPNTEIEIFGPNSFYTEHKLPDAPTLSERLAQADIIDGLPFESLKHVLYYKKLMGRNKDIKDIELINKFLLSN